MALEGTVRKNPTRRNLSRYLVLLCFLSIILTSGETRAQFYDYADEALDACETDRSIIYGGSSTEITQCQWHDRNSGWCDHGLDCYRIFHYLPTWRYWYGLFNSYKYGQRCRSSDTDCPPQPVDPGRTAGAPCAPTCGVGDPINPATGNKYQIETEYRAPDGLLEFTWTYNSQPLAVNSGRTWPLGAQRTHSYQRSILVDAQKSSMARLFRSDGDVLTFVETAGTWTSEPNVDGILSVTRTADGAVIDWRYRNANDQLEMYDPTGRLMSISTGSHVLTLSYGALGELTSVSDERGRTLGFLYFNGRISELALPDGAQLHFSYDAELNLAAVQYPGGFQRTYLYNEPAYVDGAGLPASLTGILDEAQDRHSSTYYDTSGRAVRTALAGEVDSFKLEYLPSEDPNYLQSTTVTEPAGAAAVYAFSSKHAVPILQSAERVCAEPCGLPVRRKYRYDAAGRVSEVVNEHTRTSIEHDPRGLETRRMTGGGTVQVDVQTDWHPTFRVPVERRTLDTSQTQVARIAWTYNARGQALTQTRTDPATGTSRTTTTSYCEQANISAGSCSLLGLVTSVKGSRTDVSEVTTYAYRMADEATCASSPTTCPYRKGDLWKIANPAGQVTEMLKYDGAGRVLSVKDTNGIVTDYEYHPRGWLAATKVRGPNNSTETDDRITRIEYWPTGLVKKVTQPDGAFTAYAYDAAHRLTGISDNAGNTITYTLDNAGNRVAEDTRDASGTLRRTLSRVFNQLGQLATQADASDNPTDFTYDPNGNLKTLADPLSRVTSNDYDPLNRLVRTLQDVGGIEADTRFEYDALDHLTKVIDPKGLATSYSYNAFGDLLRLDSPDTGATTYTYDSAGNRTSQTDARGQVTTYAYDALNRLTNIGYATASLNVVYTYDINQGVCPAAERFPVGRLTRIKDGSGTTQYCYDRFGQLVRKVQTTNGKAFTVRYAYTKGGHLQSMTYPDGTLVDYVRNASGQVTQAGVTSAGGGRQVVLDQARYLPFGPVEGWTYGNGQVMSRSHDLDYRPTALHGGGVNGLDLGFAFDAAGNLDTVSTASNPTPRVSLGYDGLNRLTEFRDGPTQVPIETYAYDKTGNRLGVSNSAGTQPYTYPASSHRLTRVGTVNRSHDAAGNTTAIGGTARQFVYDATGRMSQARQGGTVATHYRYNGKGERVRRHLGTANTYTVHDEVGRWLGDYDQDGAPLQQAVWLDDLPVGVLAGATGANRLHYVQPDHLGTPRAVIDPMRNVAVWTWDLRSEAFGNSPPDQDPDRDGISFVLDMRYPGQRYDAASGLNYNYFRDYDPGTGRYVESDPIGLAGGINTYLYAMGSPLLRVDPMGLQAIPLPVRPPLPIVPPHGGQPGDEADPGDYSGGNVIPFPRSKSNDTCPPDNDCVKRKAALMAQHIAIDAQTAFERIRGVYDYELTARKLLWNRTASEWNATCGPLGYPLIEPIWFYELGPRKL